MMNKKQNIYLDQNIIQYLYEGKFSFKENEDITWIYSDEHFNETGRSGNLSFLNVLKDLKARKIKINLNEKFEILNEATIFDYTDPSDLYLDYKNTMDEVSNINLNFSSMQTFFFGNKEAIDIENFILNYKESLKKLLQPLFEYVDDHNLKSKMETEINNLSNNFEQCLIDMRKQLKPIEKMRRNLTSFHCSNLNPEDGQIVKQIWDKIVNTIINMPITMDQFFGKENLYNSAENKEQPLLLKISQCHAALNFTGYWPDEGLMKQSKMYGINSDASHIGHAAFCNGIISADDRLCKKARAIYDYFDVGAKVIQINFDI